jgi:hypothetical protein
MDGAARLWNFDEGRRPLASLVSDREGGWTVIDPDGRFDASDPDNTPNLHFVAGNDVIELSQLKQRFYTPGLLGRIWRGEKLPEIATSLKNIGLVPELGAVAPPADSMIATIRLINRGGGIGKVIVKVNGREVPDATRGKTADPNAASAEIKVDLSAATLSPTGSNLIEVFAENGDGLIRSRGISVEWRRKPANSEPPKLFAIVAGSSTYDNDRLNLRYPAKDAIHIGNALRLGAEGLFGKDGTHVTILASGVEWEPTKNNIRKAFAEVAKEAHSGDVLVVYLSGHGAASPNEHDQYYYLTKEARSSIDDILRDARLRDVSTISSAELKQWLSRKNMPLKQVIMLDTCAAGAAFTEMVKLAERRELSPDQIRALELLKDATGSWILMGSAADAVSYEASRYAQGLLTYSLLLGMQGAALDGENVEVSKLFGFAQRQVEDLAKGIGGIQRPVISAPKGQTFPIGLLREQDRKQIHVATVKPELLRARALDKTTYLDPLQLEPGLRAALREASVSVTRGSEGAEPAIVYLDSVVDEVPEAVTPQVLYSLSGETVRFQIRLLQEGKLVLEQAFETHKAEPSELAKMLLKRIVKETEQVTGAGAQ